MKIKKIGAFAVPVTFVAFFMAACNHEKPESNPMPKTDKSVSGSSPVNKTEEEKTIAATRITDYTYGPVMPAPTGIPYADSLLRLSVTLPPIIGKADFSTAAKIDFGNLAAETSGSFVLVKKSSEVAKTAVKIIHDNLTKGTDVLFLVDQTGSMSDDLNNIKTGMKDIVQSLKKQHDIRCGMAFYGDKNEDANWFRHTRFTYNFDTLEEHIKNLTAIGGGDLPESVYDGFFEALKTMNVDDSRKLMVMIIGDAPSLDSTLSKYSIHDVLNFCKKRDIHINLYPMLLATNDEIVAEENEPVLADLIYSVYPNPTHGEVNFKTNRAGFYDYEVINQAGLIVRNGSLNGSDGQINLLPLSNGLYVIRLIDVESRQAESHKVVLSK